MASLANSLGAASSAVPSMSPSGRVRRRNARCCGDRGGAPEPASRSGQVADDPVPDLSEISGLVGHRVGTPLRLSPV